MGTRYKLTASPDTVIDTETGATIPRGHRRWDDYQVWLEKGNRPAPADGSSLEDKRAAVLSRINASCETAMAQLRASYPDSEVLSWSQQAKEADALLADSGAATPLLSAIASERGMNVADLAEKVRANTVAYSCASGQIIGKRQALEDALMSIDLTAKDAAEQMDAINWPSA